MQYILDAFEEVSRYKIRKRKTKTNREAHELYKLCCIDKSKKINNKTEKQINVNNTSK